MMDREPNSLEELLARLPRDIAPPDHVWAGIARDVAAGRRKLWRPIAAAAALLCICVGGALTWGVLHEHPAATGVPGRPRAARKHIPRAPRAAATRHAR
jgi:hypothetical protein